MSSKAEKIPDIKNIIASSTKGKGTAKSKAVVADFVRAFYHLMPADDLMGWTADELSTVAASLYEWGRVRKIGQHHLRVFTPALPKGAPDEETPLTVIQIVNDDMPFLVDSISSELTFQGLRIDALFHPVFNIKRDGRGAIVDVNSRKAPEEGWITESVMYIRLEQVLSQDTCDELTEALNKILIDVRSATCDWRTMLDKMDEVISGLDQHGAVNMRHGDDWNEGCDFLTYLRGNNFTFLGYREYSFAADDVEPVHGTDLGVLKNANGILSGGSCEIQGPVMVSKLIDCYSTVHRRVPMDAVTVSIKDEKGRRVGVHLFVGLFTSSTYSCRTSEVPIVRKKVSDVIARAGFPRGSHDQKALEHILEKMPRDELFHVTVADLHTMALGILRLQEKQTTALFVNRDPLHRSVSCLIYVPRDLFNTKFRIQASKIIEAAMQGEVTNFFTTLDDSPLARLLFQVRLGEEKDDSFDHEFVEQQLIDLTRDWSDRLRHLLIQSYGKKSGMALSTMYANAFTQGYHEANAVRNAVHDIRELEALRASHHSVGVDIYRLVDAPPGDLRLKVYHKDSPVRLSDIMPMLDHMGLQGLFETPYQVTPNGWDKPVWVHDFTLCGAEDINIDSVKHSFEDAFIQVWQGHAESDGLNQLVLRARLTWHEVRILRTYARFLRQARFPYSLTYVEQVLGAHSYIVRLIVDLFKAMHDPQLERKKSDLMRRKLSDELDELLHQVEKADHDKILRGFKTLIEQTLRTNYFQMDENGDPKPCLSVKLDSKRIPYLPLPRPHVEVFVYSARVEGVHLRGGEVARGGLRWSDRFDDFRTEVLGLMKAQTVKNTVIVPVGAKGGFIVKKPPQMGGREAYLEEGIACYKTFIQALLDITDNNVKGKIKHPKDVVCHDEPDPYLVVAADKGTATFSDIANGLSCDAGFWLDDAFASGGSAGYDHKKMGITARGAWESVKRHFREMGKDIQKEEFTAIGVGDMGGDVFGNGMLLSKKTRLLAAFNHLHIFFDPNPDVDISYVERKRLFDARKGWDEYDTSKLSTGGIVFERSAKILKLPAQVKALLQTEQSQMTPDELMQAVLKMDAELLWFGGIGTYIKGKRQSHADADDKANDAIRINGNIVRARVIGEGANLGVTQAGRIEYSRNGGRVNTDFIDNAAGVDCSDHEVNIKILLGDVAVAEKMTLPQRNKLLVQMTKDVAAHVLKNNYQQTQSLSLQEFSAHDDLSLHGDLIRKMEKSGLIIRQLEGLPDEETLAQMTRENMGLSRPELCVLMSWVKMSLYDDVLASSVPDDAALKHELFSYFPKALHKFEKQINKHKLRREIIATQVINTVINRMGPLFIQSRMEKTGASSEEIVKAFVIVTEAFGLNEVWESVEALDNKVAAHVQITALHELFKLCKRAVTWLLRFGPDVLDIGTEINSFNPGIALLKKAVCGLLPADGAVASSMRERETQLVNLGVPPALASKLVVLRLLSSACDIIHIARQTKSDIMDVAAAYFIVGERVHIEWLRTQATLLVPTNKWQMRVISGLTDDFYLYQARLTAHVIKFAGKEKSPNWDKHVSAWMKKYTIAVSSLESMVLEVKGQSKTELEMLVLAGQKIEQIADGI